MLMDQRHRTAIERLVGPLEESDLARVSSREEMSPRQVEIATALGGKQLVCCAIYLNHVLGASGMPLSSLVDEFATLAGR